MLSKNVLFAAILTSITSISYAEVISIRKSINAYSEHVERSYKETLDKAQVLKKVIHQFTETPSVITLEMAKKAWIEARAPYGKTEVFRFYNGPIDSDGGPEGLLNSWPLDEAYIDYVAGNPNTGIINDLVNYPVITKDLLVSLNELDGEKNISTGYHAIEFLLWGQDFFTDGPGRRSYEDYTTAPNASRRAEYLKVAADLLVDDLSFLEKEWRADSQNFRKEFEAFADTDALKKILSGIVYMAGDELAGERMYVAYDTQGQEDEHSCFSDMTHKDILWNYQGVENAIKAINLLKLPQIAGTPVAASIEARMITVTKLIASIPVPFDQAITNEEGREAILLTVEELEALARDITDASKLLNAAVDY